MKPAKISAADRKIIQTMVDGKAAVHRYNLELSGPAIEKAIKSYRKLDKQKIAELNAQLKSLGLTDMRIRSNLIEVKPMPGTKLPKIWASRGNGVMYLSPIKARYASKAMQALIDSYKSWTLWRKAPSLFAELLNIPLDSPTARHGFYSLSPTVNVLGKTILLELPVNSYNPSHLKVYERAMKRSMDTMPASSVWVDSALDVYNFLSNPPAGVTIKHHEPWKMQDLLSQYERRVRLLEERRARTYGSKSKPKITAAEVTTSKAQFVEPKS